MSEQRMPWWCRTFGHRFVAYNPAARFDWYQGPMNLTRIYCKRCGVASAVSGEAE